MTPEVVEGPDQVAIYPSAFKSGFIILVTAGFVWFGIRMEKQGVGPGTEPWELFYVSYVAVPLMGLWGLITLYQLIRGRPLLVIDSTGITDSASVWGPVYVSWSEVDHLRLFKTRRGPGLEIVLKDLDAFWSRRGGFAWLRAKLSHPFREPPVTISHGTISMPMPKLAELLRVRFGARVEGHKPSSPSSPAGV